MKDKRYNTMKMQTINKFMTVDEAREFAVDWQQWASEQSLSYGELALWQGYFTEIGKKFNLTNEFKENGIL